MDLALEKLCKKIKHHLINSQVNLSLEMNIVNKHPYELLLPETKALEISFHDEYTDVNVHIIKRKKGKYQIHYTCGYSSWLDDIGILINLALFIQDKRFTGIRKKDK